MPESVMDVDVAPPEPGRVLGAVDAEPPCPISVDDAVSTRVVSDGPPPVPEPTCPELPHAETAKREMPTPTTQTWWTRSLGWIVIQVLLEKEQVPVGPAKHTRTDLLSVAGTRAQKHVYRRS
jgi:hypothetical protein